jgi:ParB-like chromosome segregation protein Spo0J
LIALGRERFLVDGYARYRACMKLGIERARVVVQEFGEERGK